MCNKKQYHCSVYCYKGLEIAGADIHETRKQKVICKDQKSHKEINCMLLDVEVV